MGPLEVAILVTVLVFDASKLPSLKLSSLLIPRAVVASQKSQQLQEWGLNVMILVPVITFGPSCGLGV